MIGVKDGYALKHQEHKNNTAVRNILLNDAARLQKAGKPDEAREKFLEVFHRINGGK
jgi:hypothetical protein